MKEVIDKLEDVLSYGEDNEIIGEHIVILQGKQYVENLQLYYISHTTNDDIFTEMVAYLIILYAGSKYSPFDVVDDIREQILQRQ